MDTAPLQPIPENIPEAPVSRLAPTPSGYLHMGNAVNFLVTWALVRVNSGTLRLRIDDMDGPRFRRSVLEDIFESLDWLGLDWDEGPEGPEDFFRSFSLQDRRDAYRQRLGQLLDTGGMAYACHCSRATIKKASANGLYPGTCRDKALCFEPGRTAIRLRVRDNALIRVENRSIDLSRTLGDFVLWRKDDQPGYQLASLLEDEAAGTTLIVRGEDLLFSSAAQLYLAGCFGFGRFPRVRFLHHPLITGSDGKKLSKSRGAYALKDMREAGKGLEPVFRKAAKILGLGTAFTAAGAADLLAGLKERRPARGNR